MKNLLLILLLAPIFAISQTITQIANVNGPIYAMEKHGGITLIGGKFTLVNGSPANNIAYSMDMVNWLPLNGGVNDTVKDIKYFNGDFFISGSFTTANSLPNKFIVRWNSTSNQFKSVYNNQSYLGTGITKMVVIDTILYATGKDWQIPNIFGYSQGASTLYQYNPSVDTSFQNNASFPFYYKIAYNITTNGSDLYVYYMDYMANTWQIRKWDGTSWNFMLNCTYNIGYAPKAMQWFNNCIYTSDSTGVLVYNELIQSTPSNFNNTATSMMYSDGSKLWYGGKSLYTTTGTTSQLIFTTNGNIYDMVADSIQYFGGKFDTVNGSLKSNFVKYQILQPTNAMAAISDSTLCVGNSVHYTNLSTGSSPTYHWLFPGGIPSSSTSQNPTVTYNNAGVYTTRLIATNAVNSDTTYYTIYVGSHSTLSTSAPVAFCEYNTDTVAINGVNGQLSWFPSNLSNIGNSLVFDGNSSSQYLITSTNYGCVDSLVLNVTIYSKPTTPLITQNGNSLSSNQSSGNQWYFGTSILIDSIFQTIHPIVSGEYMLTYTDNNGCTSSPATFDYVYTATGINDINNDMIKIYPNPVVDIVFVDRKFTISNASGELIGEYNKSANMSNLSSGVYFITVGNHTKQIVKQ